MTRRKRLKLPLTPRQRRQKSLDAAQSIVEPHWETPRGRCDEHNNKFSLSYETKVIEPVEARKQLKGVASNLESCTTQTQDFSPTYSEVVNLTGLLKTKD